MNWKTTTCGILAIITAVANTVIFMIDGNAATNPDWPATISAVMAGFGLIFAKDVTKATTDTK